MTAENSQLEKLSRRFLRKHPHALEPREITVLQGIHRGEPTSRNASNIIAEQSTVGERLSDRVAAIGGSWSFIITFALILVGWMILNTEILSMFGMAFDPYPYIFLNLLLSTVAAIQAPVIMMSQNRQAAKDRIAAGLDYEVNLRAELEIMRLHEKIDQAILERLDRILSALGVEAPTADPVDIGLEHSADHGK